MAAVADERGVGTVPQVEIERVVVGSMGVNCWLIANASTGETLIVDPGDEADKIIAAVGERTPKAVLLTHAHYDHIGAVDAVCSHFDIPLYVHENDVAKLTDSVKNVGRSFGAEVTAHTKPTTLKGGECLTAAGFPVHVLHTPGHSGGGVCYLLEDGQGVFTGDTLFAHGYGRTDFEDGSFRELRESLRKLLYLSPKMPAFPGHEEIGAAGRDPQEDTL